MKKNNFKIDVIYEDNEIVVLSKPAGVYTIPDRFDKEVPNLYTYLKKKYGTIFTVHRLDKDTSGIIVFAKNAEAHKNLNTQFEKHTVKKLYHILTEGIIREDSLDIDIPIIVNPAKKGLSMPSARGKESLTKLKVLERFRNATFCEVELVTGRHHQIRVHCTAIGHPLLIDEFYGRNNLFMLSSVKRKFNLKKHTEEQPIISRITMHAFEISFIHPTTNQEVTYNSEYPKDFWALLQVLRKYTSIPEFSVNTF
jgi:23S rRNA pseudouridine1911/1915/1917 synthase